MDLAGTSIVKAELEEGKISENTAGIFVKSFLKMMKLDFFCLFVSLPACGL